LGERLSTGQLGAYRILGTDAALILAVNTTRDSLIRALWVVGLGGNVGFRPKANVALMGKVLTDCDLIAAASDCKAIRIEPGDRPDWKSHLLPRFGYRPLDVDGVTVMQKELAYGP
jgi:hypothetical protein